MSSEGMHKKHLLLAMKSNNAAKMPIKNIFKIKRESAFPAQ
jgi:hypothetical protein